jgi:hypothetical protein
MDQLLIDFIKADLDLCLTFMDVAETEFNVGNREHAERSCLNAEKGYADMLRFFSRATGMTAEVADELKSRFNRLRERLDGVRHFSDRDLQAPTTHGSDPAQSG